VAGSLVHLRIGPFRQNVRTAYRLGHWRPAQAPTGPPPLRRRVLLDWSGSGIGTNHQKITVVRRGSELTAAVGGIDYVAGRVDEFPHRRLSVRGGRWGWHDAGAIVRGPAAEDIWRVFRMRWINSASLPRRRFVWTPRRFPLINPSEIESEIPPAVPQPVRPAPGVAAAILRSVGPWYVDSLVPWGRRHYTSVNVAVVTTGAEVRDLRVRLWAEHLRTPLTDPELRASLEDLDLALGAFHPEWLPPDAPAGTWRRPGMPTGFAPQESVLTLVGPP
jgi:hypothetical protein